MERRISRPVHSSHTARYGQTLKLRRFDLHASVPSLVDLSLTLAESNKLVRLNAGEPLLQTTRPAHFDCIHFPCLTQTKMLAEIVLRNVARCADDFPHLLAATCADGNPRPNGGAVGLRANQLDGEPMMAAVILIQKQ